jgi:hypothetical protein
MTLEFLTLVPPDDEDYWTGNISLIADWLLSTFADER